MKDQMQYLKKGERLDDLQIRGLSVIQNPESYCFTSDAVLLANLCKSGGIFADLGSGSGVISILLAAKKQAKKVYAIELRADAADMSKRSVAFNGLQDKIEVLNIDLRGASKILGKEVIDKVVCNPPFFKAGEVCKASPDIAISRHELTVNFEQIATEAASLLKTGGYFYCIQKCDRMAECICVLNGKGLEPKKITLIYPKRSKTADTFIVECKKGAASGMVLNDLVLYEEDGELTQTAKQLYGITEEQI